MTSALPLSVFSHFHKNDLLAILEYRHVSTHSVIEDQPGEARINLAKKLAEHVSNIGRLKLFQSLPREILEQLYTESTTNPNLKESKPTVRVMAKAICREIESDDNWFFNRVDKLGLIFDELEIEKPKDDDEAVKQFIKILDRTGIEFTLSAFSLPVLQNFAQRSGLHVPPSLCVGKNNPPLPTCPAITVTTNTKFCKHQKKLTIFIPENQRN
eukprot:TRINITY_DN7749_c0_g1_i10.p1 TRINITY_DN7749_c0_g1~~TRINITY_DN7749_c0_g1_i10.p1  ORF type:complete len:213 (+),score=37.78 TRINITY_DN7749_c0_g1_i10:60-698(+)